MNAEQKPSLLHRIGEWFASHALWDFAKHLLFPALAAWLASYGGAGLLHVPAWNLFMVLVGIIGLLWSLGLLPQRGKSKPTNAQKEQLRKRCHDLIVDWEELADLWMNGRREEGTPVSLQEPMSPAWAGSMLTVWPFKVAALQTATAALREDLKRAGIPIEEWNYRISLPRLLEALRDYKARLGA
jgi:hypothetical protein